MHLAIDARMWGERHGGVGVVAREVVPRLAARLPEATFSVFTNAQGCQDLAVHGSKNMRVIQDDTPIYSPREHWGLARRMERSGATAAFFLHFSVPLGFKLPFVCMVHDLILHRFPGAAPWWKRAAYRLIMRQAIARAKKIITPSHFSAQELGNQYPFAQQKTETVHLGVDSSRFFSKKARKKAEKPYFLMLGARAEHKNAHTALAAFADYCAAGGGADFVITAKQLCPRAAKVLGGLPAEARARVRLVDFVAEDDLPALLRDAAALVLPSLAEGFGLHALEAAAARTPVLAARAASLPEVLPERAALFFSPESAKDLAATMARVERDDQLRQTMVNAASARAAELTWDGCAAGIGAVLASCFLPNT